jgi:signal transduction histidine kinase
LKHSGAGKVAVQLLKHADRLVLMVEDDGRGFDFQKEYEEGDGIGLQNVVSRAVTAGGEFFIDSVPGKGTVATIEINNENLW